MALKERQLAQLKAQIRKNYDEERKSQSVVKQKANRFFRWSLMLYHEVVHDDIPIRAQSLSYFTLF